MYRKALVIFLSVALIVIVAITIKIYGLEKLSIFKKQTDQKISSSDDSEENKLRKRYEELINLEGSKNKEAWEKLYDLYISPESKQRITKDQYIKGKEATEESFKKMENAFLKYNVNNVIVKNNTGYIDRTLTLCYDQECNSNREGRGYRKYVKINGEWFAVIEDNPIYCIRDEAYEMPEEFKRALSLIEQRYRNRGNIEEANRLDNISNCLRIEYSESGKEINGAEGVFVFSTTHSLDEYLIKVSPKYSLKDDLLTAVLLRHELTHVFQYANNEDVNSEEGCYRAEASAFISEGRFVYHVLNDEEEKSLQSRMTKTQEVAQLFQTLLVIAKNEGDLIDEKALNFIKANPYYQKQCKKE
ncbi:MAG: hypothetical protein ACD_15C00066G0018 [uncultured bacterium]|nr:MAG: hypothetical protein ACD_15C00066G0018 [uncultured bacterium]